MSLVSTAFSAFSGDFGSPDFVKLPTLVDFVVSVAFVASRGFDSAEFFRGEGGCFLGLGGGGWREFSACGGGGAAEGGGRVGRVGEGVVRGVVAVRVEGVARGVAVGEVLGTCTVSGGRAGCVAGGCTGCAGGLVGVVGSAV